MTSTQLLVWGGLVHLVADWLFQNAWMADHKGGAAAYRAVPARPEDIRPGRAVVDDRGDEWDVLQVDRESCCIAQLGRQGSGRFVPVDDLVGRYRLLVRVRAGATHPASYAHAGVHALALLLVFPWPAAVALALVHWLIDLRFVLAWWRRVFRQTTEGPAALHVALWGDQVLHLATIGAAALHWGRGL